MPPSLFIRYLALALLVCATRVFASDSTGLTAVHHYIAAKKHWKQTQYRIEKPTVENRFVVYHVVFLADLRGKVIGGGESFNAYYDSQKHKIVKILYFQ